MFLKELYRSVVLHRWDLAFVENTVESILKGDSIRVKRVKYPFQGHWFADPFILDYDEKEIILLVEDFSDADKKGKISKLVIDRKAMELKDVKLILELDTHLSFPAIIRKDDKVFIYPENSEGRTLNLYEYNMNTDECNKVRLLSNDVMADAIITDYFGDKMLFSTKDNGNLLDVYKYDDISKCFVYASNVVFKENIARNAGDFFECNGQLYRAAQECNYTYGHALSIQCITKDEKGGIKMKEIRRIGAPEGALGIHTLNVYRDLIVIDIKVFRHPWVAKPLFWFRNLFK